MYEFLLYYVSLLQNTFIPRMRWQNVMRCNLQSTTIWSLILFLFDMRNLAKANSFWTLLKFLYCLTILHVLGQNWENWHWKKSTAVGTSKDFNHGFSKIGFRVVICRGCHAALFKVNSDSPKPSDQSSLLSQPLELARLRSLRRLFEVNKAW